MQIPSNLNVTEIVGNGTAKKVWAAPVFEIISKDIIESGTSVSIEVQALRMLLNIFLFRFF